MASKTGPEIITDALVKQNVYIALAHPEKVINRLALYTSSEEKGRHTDAGMSILRYALAGYLTGVVSDTEILEPVVDPYGDEVDVSWEQQGSEHSITMEYPGWLSGFFEDDAHFAYLKADDATPLVEILDEMRRLVSNGGPGGDQPHATGEVTARTIRKADDAEAEAAQGDDPGDEPTEGESAETAADNPHDDLSRF